ncbi:MAG: 50S ribosomal protein L17 [Patescibacteria group bacterium]
MYNKKNKKTLGRKVGPRRALTKNLIQSLVLYEKIKTTETKAKYIKPKIEKIITRASENTLHNRRELMKKIPTKNAVNKLLEVIGPRYKERNGGCVRIVKLGERKGDGAKMAQIEFV